MAKMQEVTRILLNLGMKISYNDSDQIDFYTIFTGINLFLSDIPGVLLCTGTCFNKKKSKYVPSDITVIIMHASSFVHTSIKVLKN